MWLSDSLGLCVCAHGSKNNVASFAGGAFLAAVDSLRMRDTAVVGAINSAVICQDCAIFDMTQCTIDGTVGGAALTSSDSVVTLSSCAFTNNVGGDGTVRIGGGTASVTATLFTGNSVAGVGGAIASLDAVRCSRQHAHVARTYGVCVCECVCVCGCGCDGTLSSVNITTMGSGRWQLCHQWRSCVRTVGLAAYTQFFARPRHS